MLQQRHDERVLELRREVTRRLRLLHMKWIRRRSRRPDSHGGGGGVDVEDGGARLVRGGRPRRPEASELVEARGGLERDSPEPGRRQPAQDGGCGVRGGDGEDDGRMAHLQDGKLLRERRGWRLREHAGRPCGCVGAPRRHHAPPPCRAVCQRRRGHPRRQSTRQARPATTPPRRKSCARSQRTRASVPACSGLLFERKGASHATTRLRSPSAACPLPHAPPRRIVPSDGRPSYTYAPCARVHIRRSP